ncbi:hypothetical protein [Shinella sp. G-2]|uniref:hypothetical protein n=1 Tax=Shinella sp. G-2 TaxID=3133141 RepID=UPI003CFE7258
MISSKSKRSSSIDAGPSLPEDCRCIQYHTSQTAGFIHVFERDAYTDVIKTLAVPEEMRRYLQYRQNVLRALSDAQVTVVEADILAAYMSDEALSTPTSHKVLDRLFDDAASYRSSSHRGASEHGHADSHTARVSHKSP